MNAPRAAAAATLHEAPAAGDELEARYAADAWQAGELGVPARRGAGAVSFTRIDPPWLREAVKRWAQAVPDNRMRVQHHPCRKPSAQPVLRVPGPVSAAGGATR